MERSSCSAAETIFDIVRTVSSGYAPTLDSADSMTASAPSRIALATSDASARVGRELVIIDSIIWVATITGLALRRHSSMSRFCTMGTFSSGYSTARSPRATITPSNAITTSSMFSTACGFSTLAMTGTRRPTSSITLWTSRTSLASRTKDSATRSQPIRRANRRSSTSFSDSAGTFTAAPGRLMPLWSEMTPPSMTSVRTRGPSTSMTFSSTLPSLMRTWSPGETSPGSPLYVVPQICLSPGTSSAVMVNSSPRTSSTGPSAKVSRRIFGPCRSARTPMATPVSAAAARTRS